MDPNAKRFRRDGPASLRGPSSQFVTSSSRSRADLLKVFLLDCRSEALARGTLPHRAEIEVRLGLFRPPSQDGRLLPPPCDSADPTPPRFFTLNSSSTTSGSSSTPGPSPIFNSGVTRSHFDRSTKAGISSASPLSSAFHIPPSTSPPLPLVEDSYVERVYMYPPDAATTSLGAVRCVHRDGSPPHVERKLRLLTLDAACAEEPYDLRVGLCEEREEAMPQGANPATPPPGFIGVRVKRRRSYKRVAPGFVWRVDATVVMSEQAFASSSSSSSSISSSHSTWELELELDSAATARLLQSTEATSPSSSELAKLYAEQLDFMLQHLSPSTTHSLPISKALEDHPNRAAVNLALQQCLALKHYNAGDFFGPQGKKVFYGVQEDSGTPLPNVHFDGNRDKFIGCMPVSFHRRHLALVQGNSYFASEKTDGVRHLLVCCGGTVVLLDRKWHAFRPKSGGGSDPFAALAKVLNPGTVLDGEVVFNRKFNRFVYIVFDVMCAGPNQPLVRDAFRIRLQALKDLSFVRRNPLTNDLVCGNEKTVIDGDLFDASIANICPSLPLMRKTFVERSASGLPPDVDRLMSNVVEERGERLFVSGLHKHLTDGIIFQPDSPYVMGTDNHLTKWKYPDTGTIDVEVAQCFPAFVAYVEAGNGVRIDVSTVISLPEAELRRLEADRGGEGGGSNAIAEVGFDPESGDWFYKCIRSDKTSSNHIGTVIGTLLELAEGISAHELRIRLMSDGRGKGDTYADDVKDMEKQVLEHHRKNSGGVGGGGELGVGPETIDVEVTQSDPTFQAFVDAGSGGARTDISKFVTLPQAELQRLDADRKSGGGGGGNVIASVSFDPESGDWFYKGLRSERASAKSTIGFFLDTLLSAAKGISAHAREARMLAAGARAHTYESDINAMEQQILEYHRKKKSAAARR